MTSFDTLSALPRAFFALWALLLCLAGIGGVFLPLWKKRYRFSLLALVLFLPAYFMWQVIFDVALFNRLGIVVSSVTETLGGIDWVWWFVVLFALSVALLCLLGYNIRYEKSHVTLGSIKKYLDQLPCGVCCYKDTGRVLFTNMCMNELCATITDGQLLNGNSFHVVVADKILTVGDKMWRFTSWELTVGKDKLHEMIASDVTSEYAKTQALEKDKAELSRLNRELKDYNLNIDDAVRRQEILQAKVNIHDEMNRLMLSTVLADGQDAATMDKIFAMWEQNALLLCMQADDAADKKAIGKIKDLADALKIRLVWRNRLPGVLTEEQRGLFLTAAQEAVANAAKHAGAKEIAIDFAATETSVECRLTNDGDMPSGAVTFTGGLLNLKRLAERQGARVETFADENFTLAIVFPRKD